MRQVEFIAAIVAVLPKLDNQKALVQPKHVVAGLEPQRTNRMLQAVARAALQHRMNNLKLDTLDEAERLVASSELRSTAEQLQEEGLRLRDAGNLEAAASCASDLIIIKERLRAQTELARGSSETPTSIVVTDLAGRRKMHLDTQQQQTNKGGISKKGQFLSQQMLRRHLLRLIKGVRGTLFVICL